MNYLNIYANEDRGINHYYHITAISDGIVELDECLFESPNLISFSFFSWAFLNGILISRQ